MRERFRYAMTGAGCRPARAPNRRRSPLRTIVLVAMLACGSVIAVAQNAQPANQNRNAAAPPAAPARAQRAAEPPSKPAPVRDLSGMWAGSNEALLSNRIPPMTPAGQAQLKLNIPDPFSATSNDPWKTCDPFGMPRMVNNMNGQLGFAQMPGRIMILLGFARTWREVWMDGRPLPKNIGHEGGPSTMFYGYSVGHWEGNNTLVVDTVGMDDKTWNDRRGYPHSSDARVIERYTRTDHDHLTFTETLDDPTYYAQPFVMAKSDFRWVRGQDELNVEIPFTSERLCIPSQAMEYMQLIGLPADGDAATGNKK